MRILIKIAAVLLYISLCSGRGRKSEKSELCSKSDFETDEKFYECVKKRRWKRQNGDHSTGQPCSDYVTISSLSRRTGNVIDASDSPLCDRGITSRWIRFMSHAGGKIPETCPPIRSCGTVWPIYMKEAHPTRPYEEALRTVCVNEGSCCSTSWTVKVTNCADFFVYQLVSPPRCYMSYCAGEEAPCPPGMNSLSGFTPHCTSNFPDLTGKVILTPSTADTTVKFFCHYKGIIPINSFLIVDWYVAGDKASDGFERPIWTDELMERRRSELTEGRWITKMGSTVFCRIKAKWKNGTGVPSRYLESAKYFAGIKVLNRVVNVSESGETAVIQLQSTVPIKCYPEFEDNCKIIVEVNYNPGYDDDLYYLDQQAVFGDCSVEITSANWQQVHNISVKAIRDFKRDGNRRMMVEFKPIFTTVASYMWNDYRLPGVEIIASDAMTGVCQSYGDPHIITFDGLQYHVYLEGEFVLYQNTRYQMKIHVRLEKCEESATCNCALAVAVNDDVIVVDRCSRKKRNIAFGESFPDGWNTLHKHALEQGVSFVRGLRIFEHNDGRKYTIHTPTGSYLNFDIGEKWVRIDFYASSDDYKSTAGLCGTFDERSANDFTLSDGRTTLRATHDAACGDDPDVCRFAENWRVGPESSLFGEKVNLTWKGERIVKEEKYCTCRKSGKSSMVTCDYQKEVFNPESLAEQAEGVDKTGEIIFHESESRRRRKRSIDDNEFDDYFESEFVYNQSFHGHLPEWPTRTGITESDATKKCYDVIYNNMAAISCLSLFSDKELKSFHHSCVTDVKVSGGFDWLKSSLEPFVAKCVNKIYLNSSLWQPPTPPATNQRPSLDDTQAAGLLTAICPGSCSNRGTCVERRCRCNDGFQGADCAIDSSTVPRDLRMTSPRICDLSYDDCRHVSIAGSNFLKGDVIVCNFVHQDGDAAVEQTNVTFEFVTFEKILCPLPLLSSAPFGHFRLNVIVADKSFNSSLGHVTIFDSKCCRCWPNDGHYKCSMKEGTCSIDGVCFEEGEANPANCCQTCSPEVSSSSFTPRVLPEFWLSPAGGELTLETCNVTGRKLIEAGPRFECGFRFDVEWIGDACQSLIGFSVDGSSILVTVKRCRRASCQFRLSAWPECTSGAEEQEAVKSQYVIAIPGDDESQAYNCQVEERNGTDVDWEVRRGEVARFNFASVVQLEAPVIYSIIKKTSGDVSIDSSGEITYKASDDSRNGEDNEELIVLSEKSCLQKIYTNMRIHLRD